MSPARPARRALVRGVHPDPDPPPAGLDEAAAAAWAAAWEAGYDRGRAECFRVDPRPLLRVEPVERRADPPADPTEPAPGPGADAQTGAREHGQ